MEEGELVETVFLRTHIWQQTDGSIGKAALVTIQHLDSNSISMDLQNGVSVVIAFQDDGEIFLHGWLPDDGTLFSFPIVGKDGKVADIGNA